MIAFIRANEVWAIPIVFLLAFAESLAFLSLLVPSTVFLVAIGGLLGASGINFWQVWVAAGLGGTLGYAISYWVGLYFKDSIHKIWPFTRYPQMIPKGQRFSTDTAYLASFLGTFRTGARCDSGRSRDVCHAPVAVPDRQCQLSIPLGCRRTGTDDFRRKMVLRHLKLGCSLTKGLSLQQSGFPLVEPRRKLQ